MSRVTMSKVGALRDCRWWARPEAQWVYTPSGPAAEFGNAVHAEVAYAIEAMSNDKVPTAHRDHAIREAAESVVTWWHNIRETHDAWMAEPAYVLDVTGAARHVGTNIGRKYPRTSDSEIAGSADIVGVGDTRIGAEGGVASVFDVKTGRRENVEPVEDNAQLLTLALAIHLAHGVDTVRVGLVFPTASGVIVDEHSYDALDLAAWQHELSALVADIPTSQPKPSKKACQWCPAKASCPAMTSALAEVAPKRRLPVVMSARDIQGPDHARELYETARAAKSALEQVWSALRVYAEEHGPIDLGNGRAYGPRQTTRESIDLSSRAAVDALKSALGPAWEFAVSLESSKAAIKQACKVAAVANGVTAASLERNTLSLLRDAGAVKTSTSTTWDEMDTKKESAA